MIRRTRRRDTSASGSRRMALVCAAVLSLVALPAPVRAGLETPPAEACLSANQAISLGARLPRIGARLRAGEPITIVAIGSSSTTGFGTLSPDSAFPEVMRRELTRLRPAARVEVINSGRIADTIPGNLARFERDVLAYKPDLVIWQLGVNDIVWGGTVDETTRTNVTQGVQLLKRSGAEVALMDLQYAPRVLWSDQHPAMQALISDVAKAERIGLFSRFALMKRAIDSGVPASALVFFDGLHQTADGYDCVGRALARAIDAAAREDDAAKVNRASGGRPR